MNPYQVVKDFEKAIGEYTGAPYAVTVNSCTMALLLAVAWHLKIRRDLGANAEVEIPKRTYVSVPMSIIHAGGRPTFRDEDWRGLYQLKPLPVWDSARWFSHGMYAATNPVAAGNMICCSFHWGKTLGIQQGGAILLDDYEAAEWLKKARFDGRTERMPPSLDTFTFAGWHCYMSPEVAAEGLMRLSLLRKHNDPLPNDEYPDLSLLQIFQ